jgi:hypothetical protein
MRHPWGDADVHSDGRLELRFHAHPPKAEGTVSTIIWTDHVGEIRNLKVTLEMIAEEMRRTQTEGDSQAGPVCPECGSEYDPAQSGVSVPEAQPDHELRADATHWTRVCTSTQDDDPYGYLYVHTDNRREGDDA